MPTTASLIATCVQEINLRIKLIQDQYEADMARRFKWLEGQINTYIIDDEMLGGTPLVSNVVSEAEKFVFTNKPAKVAQFMAWLTEQENAGILEIIRTEGGAVVHSGWQDTYVKRSYSKGVEWAEKKMKELGIVPPEAAESSVAAILSGPTHADALGVLYTRDFAALNKVTTAMDEEISRVLAEGLSQGKNPRAIASDIAGKNGRVRKIGLTRARAIARTETANALNEATLNRLETYQVTTVEWIYSGGLCPSQICVDNDGVQYSIGAARGLLPAHPNSYSDDTDVYTSDGWVPVRELEIGAQCLSLNPETHDLAYHPVIATTNHAEPEMIHFHSRNFDLLVTPDHDVYCKRRKRDVPNTSKWEFIKAKDVPNESSFYRSSQWQGTYPAIITINGQGYHPSWFAKFMGWWLSEGGFMRDRIVIHQSSKANPEKYQDIVDLLSERYGDYLWAGERYVVCKDDALYDYLNEIGPTHEKYIPAEIKGLSPGLIRDFLDCFAAGDGHIRKGRPFKGGAFRDQTVYTTSSTRMADGLGELLIKVGHRPSYNLQKSKGKIVRHHNGEFAGNFDIWHVSECYSQTSIMGYNRGIVKETVPYNKMAYCVEIENWHTLLVRRNGKVTWCGNCECAWGPVV